MRTMFNYIFQKKRYAVYQFISLELSRNAILNKIGKCFAFPNLVQGRKIVRRRLLSRFFKNYNIFSESHLSENNINLEKPIQGPSLIGFSSICQIDKCEIFINLIEYSNSMLYYGARASLAPGFGSVLKTSCLPVIYENVTFLYRIIP